MLIGAVREVRGAGVSSVIATVKSAGSQSNPPSVNSISVLMV